MNEYGKPRPRQNRFQLGTALWPKRAKSILSTTLVVAIASIILCATRVVAAPCFDNKPPWPYVIGNENSDTRAADAVIKRFTVDATETGEILVVYENFDSSISGGQDDINYAKLQADGTYAWHQRYQNFIDGNNPHDTEAFGVINYSDPTFFMIGLVSNDATPLWKLVFGTMADGNIFVEADIKYVTPGNKPTKFQIAGKGSDVFVVTQNGADVQVDQLTVNSGGQSVTHAGRWVQTSTQSSVLTTLAWGITDSQSVIQAYMQGSTFGFHIHDPVWGDHYRLDLTGKSTMEPLAVTSSVEVVLAREMQSRTDCFTVWLHGTSNKALFQIANFCLNSAAGVHAIAQKSFAQYTYPEDFTILAGQSDENSGANNNYMYVSFADHSSALITISNAEAFFSSSSATLSHWRRQFIQQNSGEVTSAGFFGTGGAGLYGGLFRQTYKFWAGDCTVNEFGYQWPLPYLAQTASGVPDYGFAMPMDHQNSCNSDDPTTATTDTIFPIAQSDLTYTLTPPSLVSSVGAATDKKLGSSVRKNAETTNSHTRKWCANKSTTITVSDPSAIMVDQLWVVGTPFSYDFVTDWTTSPTCDESADFGYQLGTADLTSGGTTTTLDPNPFTMAVPDTLITNPDLSPTINDVYVSKAYIHFPDGQCYQHDWTVTVANRCPMNQLSVTAAIADEPLAYLDSTPYTAQMVVSQTELASGCTIVYSLEARDVGGTYAPVAVFGAGGPFPWITSFDSTTGDIAFSSSDFNLDQSMYDVRITATDTVSTDPLGSISDEFQVTWNDPCRLATVTTAPSTSSPSFTQDVFEPSPTDTIQPLVMSDATCVNIQYEVQDSFGTPVPSFTVDTSDPANPVLTLPRSTNIADASVTPKDYKLVAKLWNQAGSGVISTHQYPFQLTLSDPCLVAGALSDVASNIWPQALTRFVTQTAQSFNVDLFVENLPANYYEVGESDHCGTIDYDIVDSLDNIIGAGHPITLGTTASGQTVSLQTNDAADITSGPVQLYYRAFFTNYGSTAATVIKQPFTYEVTACVLSSVTPLSTVSGYTYDIYDPMYTHTVAAFTQSPACGYQLTYSFEVYDGTTWQPLSSYPVFGATGTENRDLTMVSNDASDKGTYPVRVVVEYNDGTTTVFSDSTNEFFIIFSNTCEVSTVGTSTTDYITYTINDPAVPETKYPSWTISDSKCPSVHSFYYEDNSGAYVPISPSLSHVSYQVIGQTNTKFEINTQDFSLDQTSETYLAKFESTDSTDPSNSAEVYYIVNYIDFCWLETLSGGTWNPSSNTFEADHPTNTNDMPVVNLFLTSGKDCGGVTRELEYVHGGPLRPSISDAQPDMSFWTWDGTNTYQAINFPRSWVGVHSIKMTSWNGNTKTDRGVSGLFNSVEDVMSLTITDRCENAVLLNNRVLTNMETTVGADLPDVQGFEDYEYTITYSTNYYCGDLEYDVVLAGTSTSVIDDYINVQQASSITSLNMDEIDQIVAAEVGQYQSSSVILAQIASGRDEMIGTHNLELVVSAPDWSNISAIRTPFTLEVKACVVSSFAFSSHPVYEYYTILKPTETYSWSMTQNCNYHVDWFAEIINQDGDKEPLPGFMSQTENQLFVKSKNRDDAGIYSIKVTGFANSPYLQYLEDTFTMTLEVIAPFDWPDVVNTPPYFTHDLVDQRFVWGQEWVYVLGQPIDKEGDHPKVQVTKEDCSNAVFWDESEWTFKVLANSTTREDVGFCEIKVNLTDSDEIESAHKVYFFVLEIQDKFVYKGPYNELAGWTVVNLTDDMITERERKPVPWIVNLEYNGVLTIAFDVEMQIPSDFNKISEEKFAFRDMTSVNILDLDRQNDDDRRSHYEYGGESNLTTPSGFEYYPESGRQLYEERMFKTPWGFEQLHVVPVLELSMIPGGQSDPQQLNFTWDMIDFQSTYFQMQLDFDMPPAVSAQPELDKIEVIFYGNQYFQDSNGNQVAYGTRLQKEVYRQLDIDEAAQIERLCAILDVFIKVICLFALLWALFFMDTWLPVWCFVNSMQIMLHSPLINVQMPANAAIFMGKLLDISRLQILPWTQRIQSTWDFERQGSVNSVFEQYGYTSYYLVPNLGIMLYAVIIFGVIAAVAGVYDWWMLRQKSGKMLTYRTATVNLFWRFSYEAFFEVFLCVLINIKAIGFETTSVGQNASNFFAFMFLIGTCLFVLFVFNKTREPADEPYDKRYETMYLGLKPNRYAKIDPACWPTVFLLRRIIYASSLVFLSDYPIGQCFILIGSCVVTLAYLRVYKPFEDFRINWFCIFLEWMCLIVGCFILCFTQFVDTALIRFDIGKLVVALVAFTVITGLCVIIYFMLRRVLAWCIKKYGCGCCVNFFDTIKEFIQIVISFFAGCCSYKVKWPKKKQKVAIPVDLEAPSDKVMYLNQVKIRSAEEGFVKVLDDSKLEPIQEITSEQSSVRIYDMATPHRLLPDVTIDQTVEPAPPVVEEDSDTGDEQEEPDVAVPVVTLGPVQEPESPKINRTETIFGKYYKEKNEGRMYLDNEGKSEEPLPTPPSSSSSSEETEPQKSEGYPKIETPKIQEPRTVESAQSPRPTPVFEKEQTLQSVQTPKSPPKVLPKPRRQVVAEEEEDDPLPRYLQQTGKKGVNTKSLERKKTFIPYKQAIESGDLQKYMDSLNVKQRKKKKIGDASGANSKGVADLSNARSKSQPRRSTIAPAMGLWRK